MLQQNDLRRFDYQIDSQKFISSVCERKRPLAATLQFIHVRSLKVLTEACLKKIYRSNHFTLCTTDLFVSTLSAIVIPMRALIGPKQKIIAVIISSLLIITGAIVGMAMHNNSADKRMPNHEIGEKYFVKGFGDGTFIYNCSKEIEVVYMGSSMGPGVVYRPVNQDEFGKYCRSSAAIEYRAVLDILRRKDIDQLVDKYDQSQVWARALGHKYIHDKDYLRRILPAYSDVKIDCIIVVHSPEGSRFFIENGEVHKSHDDHQYLEVSSEEFLASLNKASDSDRNNFWLALH